jgi:spore germination protein KC
MKKVLILLLLFLINIPLLTGCWNYREPENLPIVAGFAIDKGQNGYKYHLTFEIVQFTSGGKDEKFAPALLESDGNTLFDATRNADNKIAHKLYFSSCEIVIISKDILKDGISPLLDWLIRIQEQRYDTKVLISNENTAQEILKQNVITTQIASFEIAKDLDNDLEQLSEAPTMRLYQVADIIGSKGISLVLPTVGINKNVKQSIPEIQGSAIFKKDKLIGFLDSNDTKFYLFATNKVIGGLILVNDESKSGDNVTLKIYKNATKITPSYADGKLKVNIAIRTGVELSELETTQDIFNDKGLLQLEKTAEKTLQNNIISFIKKVQSKYDSDIFGIGNQLYLNNPNAWKEASPAWDTIFKNAEINVTVKIDIEDSAKTKSPVKEGD